MKKIQIKGKDYIEVNERVKQFHIDYPNGSITTELIEMTDRFITKTTVIPDVKFPDRKFTGLAYEKEDSTFINKTSALENAETSSVGRSLGFLSIGIDTSIASYDEVANAVTQQKDKPKTIPPVNLKDQEVPNPHYDKVVNELGGIPLGDDESDNNEWTGNEIIKFGKYRDVAWKDCLDENYINWVATSSKVDWQRELALKEIKRRSK
tara:strand:- start:2636 stop:3259 length:624 start_codon:yes stop_codon:yes gene_type:complete